MATIAKNFRVKNGLVVEGTVATVNGNNILTAGNTTDDITEGTSNLFFSDERVQDAVNALVSAGTHSNITVTYDDENNSLSFAADASLIPDTDSLAEGTTNLYYTDERVQDAVNALIAGGTHENITITYDDASNTLSFVAENGVADSTTDDLSEGVTNLYFTDARALSATSAAYDAAGSAATAESNANSYTDGEIGTLDTSLKAYADQAEADAITSANSYTDGEIGTLDTSLKAYADQAEADAISTAATDATTKANAAEAAANLYTDNLIGDVTVDGTGGNTVTDRIASAVSSLVDSAPGTLDTLNELAAALGDDPNFATTIATDIGTKVSKSGDSMTGDLTLAQDPTLSLHAATKQYVDTAEADAVSTAAADATSKANAALASAQSYADQAEIDAVASAKAYTDGRETAITTAYQSYADTAEADAVTTANAYTDTRETAITAAYQSYADTAEADAIATAAADATTKANTAESNANTYTDNAIAAADTDDIQEGTGNLYFTDERAQDAVAAAIAAGTHSNITITYDDAGNALSFAAENGVADSTTDDLTEGTSNLYFTDQRAVDALQAVTPVFTEVDVNSLSKIVATTVDVATQNTTGVVASFDSGTYTSAKFVVKADTGLHTEVTEILLTLDSSLNIAITEYANVNTGGSLMDVTAVMNGTNVEIQATVVNDNTTVRAAGTLIA